MGSWSVYCGVSQIAITSGQKCVLLPLKKAKGHGMTYYPWLPAALPIFGEYNDYGGIENIEVDENTKLIEDHFGVTIDEFATFFVDGKHTYQRDEYEEVKEKVKNLEELEDWNFMWIDRKVYDFMIKNHDVHDKGYMDYGTPEMLEAFGFSRVEGAECTNYDPKRFNQLWQKGDVKLYSDGHTLLSYKGNRYIYYFGKGCESSLETYFEVPEELQYLKDLTAHEAWRVQGKSHKSNLDYIIGVDRVYESPFSEACMEAFMDWLKGGKQGEMPNQDDFPNILKPTNLAKKYLGDLDKFGDSLAGLINMSHNFHAMSGYFAPFVLYLTPQCGEYEHHQILLDEFSKINKGYIEEREAY